MMNVVQIGAHIRAPIRKLRLRGLTEEAWDRLRLQIDLHSDPVYQPLSWLGRTRPKATRAEGVESRWEAMLPLIEQSGAKTAVDIGCNIGWYALELASRGIVTIGIENHPPYYRTAIYAARKSAAAGLGVLVFEVTPTTAALVPSVDCTVFLAIWHHLVQAHGLDRASSVLATVWGKTEKLLFFESGEDGFPPSFSLPAFEPDAKTWLTEYLSRVCEDATVTHLGLHQGGRDETGILYRNLFALTRATP